MGKVVTDSINVIHVSMPFHTLRALSLMTDSGYGHLSGPGFKDTATAVRGMAAITITSPAGFPVQDNFLPLTGNSRL
ncbi:MAG: hypothetical protein WBI33_07640 [Bacteroidales bacterium]|jgi:anionic cell wall polymer biosynthesis LytR-Cps2A-Psr (LCP) family protein